jgi:hypothetical protein
VGGGKLAPQALHAIGPAKIIENIDLFMSSPSSLAFRLSSFRAARHSALNVPSNTPAEQTPAST